MMTIAELVLTILAVPVLWATGYLALLTLLSRRTGASELASSHFSFSVVVPAHDEASGIGATVTSLLDMDYPRRLFSVIVVADNCTDETAERARAAGARVLVRTDPVRKGKGYALAHAFTRLLGEGRSDAMVVVDADSVVSPNLLQVFGSSLDKGANAVQADYAVRNPGASWRTRLMSIALAMVHTLRSLARERLGVSVGLHGNGMCFRTTLLERVPYNAFSIVEDLEFGLRLGEAGYRVAYAPTAHVYGDMPTGERASRTQRKRWEGGRLHLARAHALRLLIRGFRRRDRVALDLPVGLLVPPLTTIACLLGLGVAASIGLSWHQGTVVGVTWLWVASVACISLYVARGWQLSRTGAEGLRALMWLPIYMGWKLTLPFRRQPYASSAWVRTARGEESS